MAKLPEWFKSSWDPLKQKTRYTLIAAAVVLAVIVVIITLSKLNEHNRNAVSLPMKNRIKDIVKTADAYIKSASRNVTESRGYHDYTKAMAYIEAAKQLVGVQNLPAISGYNITMMDNEAENVYNKLVENGRIKPVEKQPMFDTTVVSNTPNITTMSDTKTQQLSIKERVALQRKKFNAQK